MAVRKRGVIERRTPDPEPLSGALPVRSLFGEMQNGFFAGLTIATSTEDNDENLSGEQKEKEESEVLPVSGEPWKAHSEILPTMSGFGNRNVFDRLEELSKGKEGEELE